MGKKRNRYLGGGIGFVGSGVWGVYSNLTTLRDLPDDAGWIAEMIADPPVYAPWLLFAACALFLAWVFWDRDIDNDDTGNVTTQTSNGEGSPIISNNSAPVTLHYNTPPKPEKPKSSYTYNLAEALKGGKLQRAMSGNVIADYPLEAVLVRLYKSFGGMPEATNNATKKAFRRKVDLAISDAVVDHRMTVKGRLFDRPREFIGIEIWKKAHMNHRNKRLEVLGQDSIHPLCYTDLLFSKSEVDEIWPDE